MIVMQRSRLKKWSCPHCSAYGTCMTTMEKLSKFPVMGLAFMIIAAGSS